MQRITKASARETSALLRSSVVNDVHQERSSNYLNILRPSQIYEASDGNLQGGASTMSSTINMVNTILGAGLLNIPSVFGKGGWVLSIFLILMFAILSVFTNYILVDCFLVSSKPYSFNALADRAWKGMSLWVDVAVVFNSLGAMAAYMIVVGDCFKDVFGSNRRVWVIVGFAIAAPLTFLRTLDSLRVTSLIAVISILYITAVVVTYSITAAVGVSEDNFLYPYGGNITAGATEAQPASVTKGLGAASALGMGFNAIFATPMIYAESASPTRSNMLTISGVAFTVATGLYLLVGVCGALRGWLSIASVPSQLVLADAEVCVA